MRIQSYGTCDLRVSPVKVAEVRASEREVRGLVAQIAQGLIASVVSTSTAPAKPLSAKVSDLGEKAKSGITSVFGIFKEAILETVAVYG
jgi:hypothetical protein